MLKIPDLQQTPILYTHRSLFFSRRIPESNAALQIPNPSNAIYHRSDRIQSQTRHSNPALFARRGRRSARSQNTIRIITRLVSLAASNLKLLPPPLDFVLEEIGGGDGGGGRGFWKGFGWDGFDGWRRRKRRKNGNLWMYGFAVICLAGFLFWGEIESNAIWWGLGFGPLWIAVIRRLDKFEGVQGWVFLGFALWSFAVGMSFRREELRRWFSGIRKLNKRKKWNNFLRK